MTKRATTRRRPRRPEFNPPFYINGRRYTVWEVRVTFTYGGLRDVSFSGVLIPPTTFKTIADTDDDTRPAIVKFDGLVGPFYIDASINARGPLFGMIRFTAMAAGPILWRRP